MNNYDLQYESEKALFGQPYEEFEEFVKTHALQGGRALDIGCGQGRDALMLARHGYEVTGVDASRVGIDQMLAEAIIGKFSVEGIVSDIYTFQPEGYYDAIVLDSILHFEKADRDRELKLLNQLTARLNDGGFIYIFVHKSPKKESEVRRWLSMQGLDLVLVKEGYIPYIYEEKSTGFKSKFEMHYFYLQRISVL